MKAIELATRHYRENKRQFIEVEEWKDDSGKPLRIYWELPTLSERQRVVNGSENDAEFVAELARNEDGSRMFDAEDALKLRDGVDGAILTRIMSRMVGGARVTKAAVEQAEKN
jgi:hypothetical protein